MATKNYVPKKIDEVPLETSIYNDAYGYPEYRACEKVLVDVYEEKEEEKPDQLPKSEQLFDLIFSVNPRTKLPDGDIAMFMNDNTSPEVREFIRQNLMSDNGLETDGAKYNGLDDDTIALYTRNQGESLSQYRDRMYGVVYGQYQQRKAETGKTE